MTSFLWYDQTLLVFDGQTVVTRYPDETETGGPVVPEDIEHADNLKIVPIHHRFAHEMIHHLTARAMTDGEYGCPILWAAAHKVEMPKDAEALEWYYTAVTYFAIRGRLRNAKDSEAIVKLLGLGVDIMRLADQLTWSLQALKLGIHLIEFERIGGTNAEQDTETAEGDARGG